MVFFLTFVLLKRTEDSHLLWLGVSVHVVSYPWHWVSSTQLKVQTSFLSNHTSHSLYPFRFWPPCPVPTGLVSHRHTYLRSRSRASAARKDREQDETGDHPKGTPGRVCHSLVGIRVPKKFLRPSTTLHHVERGTF